MGQGQSTDCCDWSPDQESIYVSGVPKIMSAGTNASLRRVCYSLSRRQKRDLKKFFFEEYSCVTDLSRGLVVYLPEGVEPPERYQKVMVKFTCIKSLAYFYLQPIDVNSVITSRINSK